MRPRNNRGFTLVEIILAMSFTAVIVIILFAALRLGYRAQEKGDARAEDSQRVRIITDRLNWLLRGAYPYTVSKGGKPKLFFSGTSGSIGLVTTSVDARSKGPEDLPGLKWISIFTDSKGLETTEKVFFLEDVFDETGGKTYLLDPDVRKLAFEYFDLPPDQTAEGEWVADWDGEEKPYLPSAIRVTITYTKNGREAEMPEMIVAIHTIKKLR